jgi:hypothetical protein
MVKCILFVNNIGVSVSFENELTDMSLLTELGCHYGAFYRHVAPNGAGKAP